MNDASPGRGSGQRGGAHAEAGTIAPGKETTGPLPRPLHRGRLFRKYLLLILSLVTGALLASGAISVYFTYQETTAALSDLQQEKAIAAASRIEQYVQRIEQQLAFASLPQLGSADVELRRIEFLKLLRQAPEVTDIAQIDPSGHEQIAVSRLGMDTIGSGKDRSQEPAFRNAKRGQSWFGPVYFRKETEPYMTIALRSGGDAGPVTVAEVNLKFIWDVVSRIKIGDKGKAYVVDGNGFLVADPDIGLVLRKTQLSSLRHVQAAISGRPAEDSAMVSTDLAGTKVLASAVPIETLGWKVFVEQPVAEVYAKLDASILRTGLLLLGGLVISALAALALARGMARPIRTLDEGARRIGEGNLDQQIVVHTGDELEGLAAQFNRMTAQLRESYAGLERKVAERTAELTEALEQRKASAEVLGVISGSIADAKPVFDKILQSCQRLFDGHIVGISLVGDDGMLHDAGSVGAADPKRYQELYPMPLTRDWGSSSAILERRVLHYPDTELDDVPIGLKRGTEVTGFHSALFAPLLLEGRALGTLWVGRKAKAPFSEKQIGMLRTFADQAVIAIENARLFNETKSALEQQTAISGILRVISSSPTDVQPVLDAVAERAAHLCDAPFARVLLVDGDVLRPAAEYSVGPAPESRPVPLNRTSLTGRAAIDRKTIHHADIVPLIESEYPGARENIRRLGCRAVLAVPLMREGGAYGGIFLYRREPRMFAADQVALVETFASQAAIAIDNVRLFNETREALEQQTAISEILRVISGSPGDVRPMLNAVAERALRLCDAAESGIFLVDGDSLRFATGFGRMSTFEEGDRQPLTRSLVVGRATIDGATIHHADVVPLLDTEYPDARVNQLKFGFRAILAVPLMREDRAIGAFALWRTEARAFTDKQIALVKTFADQAAIAIENVRLFNETKDALDRQRASGEVLAAISSSIADTAPVFERILESCERLFAGKLGVINLVGDDGLVRLGAYHGPGREEMERVYPFPANETSGTGTAILRRGVVHFADVENDKGVPPLARTAWAAMGIRATIGAPMMWENKGIGSIFVGRDYAGPFSEKDIALLKTFADQAVIAIQNARLFNETNDALDQQRASGEVLATISSSIANTKPVFDVILRSCQRLFAGHNVGVMVVRDDGMLDVGAYIGPGHDELLKLFPRPLDRNSGAGMAILDRSLLQFPDLDADDVPPVLRQGGHQLGNQSILFAPMLFEERAIGALWVGRAFKAPFTAKQLALLKTFAEQAVIAIQNARLFHEIEDKSRQLEIANKHKSEFLANMSHELRTPLNAIIGFSEVLLERLFGDLNDKQDDYLKDIHSSGKHLLGLINDILDLSKIEAGRMELERGAFDLPSALANALTLVRERAQRHGIALGLDIDPALGEVVADERKLKQILLNLLSNAVKFTPDGGHVDLIARREPARIVIAVRDTGVGIAPEDQAAVFEEFRQVGSDYTRKQEGTGLGLALARRFVELHGGHLSLDSAPGKGSTFTFDIPLSP